MAEELSTEQEKEIKKLNVFKIKGRDKHGRKILRIIGKYFPAKELSVDVFNQYLEKEIFPKLERPFAVVYIHTEVCKSEIFPGISFLRPVYDSIPVTVKQNLETVYFVHPDLQSRLFLTTFGRFIFTGGLDYLWDHVRRNKTEIPEFVRDHDEDLEY
ncbi:putative CRAL-TRIO lipid binding domain-containing protein [Helianthus anomalus]